MNLARTAAAILIGWLAATGAAQCINDLWISKQVVLRAAPYSNIGEVLDKINAQWPGSTVADAIESRQTYIVQLPASANELQVEAALLTWVNPTPQTPNPNLPLLWVEKNYLGQASEPHSGTIYITNVAPNAPELYAKQYSVAKLGLESTHLRSTGVGTVVAVLDTGIDAAHPALAGAVMSSGYNFISNSTNTSDVGNGVDEDGDGKTDEGVGHGTYVAGLIRLVAPDTKLLPVVVLNDDGFALNFTIAKGMYYAIDHGVEVINMSLGSTYKAEAFEDALDEAEALGIAVVGAAGNLNNNTCPEYPAAEKDAFGVAAVRPDDVKAAFSNFYKDLTISAFGTSLQISTNPPLFDPNATIYSTVPGGGYAAWEGTSMAAALVSGSLALIRAQHPEWPSNLATSDQQRAILVNTAVNINNQNPGYAGELGAGRLNTAAAVELGPVQPTPGDFNGDGKVDQFDLGKFLGDWGKTHTSADLDGDGIVGQSDLGILLMNWTG